MLVGRFVDIAVGENPTVRIGPGQYELPGMAAEIKKKVTKSKQDGPFGSSTKRFQRFSSFDTPGPGQYTKIEEPPERLRVGQQQQQQQRMRRHGGGPSSTASSLSSTSAAAAAAQQQLARSSSSTGKLQRGVRGPGGSGIMRGTLVRRAVTPDGARNGAGSAAFKGPPRDPEDYDRSDPNTRAIAEVATHPRRDPSMVRRKRTEAGGGSTGHGISATARKGGNAKAVGPTPSTYSVLAQKSLQSGGSWSTKAGPDISRGGKRFPDPKADTAAGPGSYQLPSAIQVPGKYQRVRGIMDSTEQRMVSHKPTTNVPGPGAYDVALNYGNLLRPTFNVAIAEASADIRF